MNKDSS